MDTIFFTDPHNGKVYAKGYFNRSGMGFYVLPGYRERFAEVLGQHLKPGVPFFAEETSELPGDTTPWVS